MEFYDKWLSSCVRQYTAAGNTKPASRDLFFDWILEVWNRLDKELIKLFKPCALNLTSDDSEDSLIHCFQDGQTYSTGSRMLGD